MNLTKGHNNLTKLNEIVSCICARFYNENNIWLWIGISYHRETLYFCFFKIKYSGYQASRKRRSQQLYLTISQLTTTQIWIMLFATHKFQVLRFELLSQRTQNQVEHKVVTKHMKEINRATVHHLNKENLHHAYYTY